MHLVQELYDFAEENKEWLRIFQLRRAMVNFVAVDLTRLVRVMKRKLKKIQYRPDLIDGCLAGAGLTIRPGLITQPAPTSSI